MKYLEIRTYPSKNALDDENPEPMSLDFLCLGIHHKRFFYQVVERWITNLGHPELVAPDSPQQQMLVGFLQAGLQKPANTASLIRFALVSADFQGTRESPTKLNNGHLYLASKLFDKLAADSKRSSGYIGLPDDEWSKLKEIVDTIQAFRVLALVPFLKIIEQPLDEIPEGQEERPVLKVASETAE